MEDLNYSAADLDPGEIGTVQTIRGDRPLTQRLFELGFMPGIQIRCLGVGMGGSPIRIEIDGRSTYALRRVEAEGVILS